MLVRASRSATRPPVLLARLACPKPRVLDQVDGNEAAGEWTGPHGGLLAGAHGALPQDLSGNVPRGTTTENGRQGCEVLGAPVDSIDR